MTTITVTSAGDAGPGTLRAAIEAVNAGEADRIAFAIGDGFQTIEPSAPLPEIMTPVEIDGRSQPGFLGLPAIRIDGAAAGAGSGLVVRGGSSRILGLSLTRWAETGIVISDLGDNIVSGCHLGTDQMGTERLGNGIYGISVHQSPDNLIGGPGGALDLCVISANGTYGISIGGPLATGNVVAGCYVGLTRDGMSRLGNVRSGILVYNAPGNRIGGYTAAERNVISGNGRGGITFDGAAKPGEPDHPFAGQGHCHDNFVVGNFIGTNKTGYVDVGNGLRGVLLNYCQDCVVGGGASGAANTIAGNDQDGVLVLGPEDHTAAPLQNANRNRIDGNRIGLAPNGNVLRNGRDGVRLANARATEIGRSAGNVIRYNAGHGVIVTGTAASTNEIFGSNVITGNLKNPQVVN